MPHSERSNQDHIVIEDSNRCISSTNPYTSQLYPSPSPHIIHSPNEKGKGK